MKPMLIVFYSEAFERWDWSVEALDFSLGPPYRKSLVSGHGTDLQEVLDSSSYALKEAVLLYEQRTKAETT